MTTESNAISDINQMDNTYLTGETSKMLGMASTTVRKYSQSLEDKGYSFLKGKGTGQHQARIYTEKDITVLRYLKEIREDSNITVDRATSIVIQRFGVGATQDTLPISTTESNEMKQRSEQHKELKEIMHQQYEMIQEQSDLIHKQGEYMKSLADKLDQQQKQINDSTKQQEQLLLNTKEENETAKKKKGFFARLFNK